MPSITDHVDPITFKSGPINRQEYRSILKEAGIALPTRKPRKKIAAALTSKDNVRKRKAVALTSEEDTAPRKKAKNREFIAMYNRTFLKLHAHYSFMYICLYRGDTQLPLRGYPQVYIDGEVLGYDRYHICGL